MKKAGEPKRLSTERKKTTCDSASHFLFGTVLEIDMNASEAVQVDVVHQCDIIKGVAVKTTGLLLCVLFCIMLDRPTCCCIQRNVEHSDVSFERDCLCFLHRF